MGYRKLQGVTEGENGLQELTGYYYKGLQRVTRGYRVLRGATGGYKRLQEEEGVTEDYKCTRG